MVHFDVHLYVWRVVMRPHLVLNDGGARLCRVWIASRSLSLAEVPG